MCCSNEWIILFPCSLLMNHTTVKVSDKKKLLFVEHFVFFQPDWYVEPDQNCTLPLVKNVKIHMAQWLVGPWPCESGLMSAHIVLMGTAFWVKVTAHRLNEDNICTKLNGNRSMHTKVITQTRPYVLWPLNVSCGLGLCGMDPCQGHCTMSQWWQHLYQVRW